MYRYRCGPEFSLADVRRVCRRLFAHGGLKAVALTDIIQVVLLVLGGLLIAWILLDEISEGAGIAAGFQLLMDRAPEKFDMILSPSNPHYMSLPGLSVLIGGMWVMNVSYWGFNQYIIQRALAAKSIDEAIAFAAFLKLLMPIIVVLPGIAVFVGVWTSVRLIRRTPRHDAITC